MSVFSTTEEELEHRRVLLRLATRGNARARSELEHEYHARVYSAAQRAAFTPKVRRDRVSGAVQRKVDALLWGIKDTE